MFARATLRDYTDRMRLLHGFISQKKKRKAKGKQKERKKKKEEGGKQRLYLEPVPRYFMLSFSLPLLSSAHMSAQLRSLFAGTRDARCSYNFVELPDFTQENSSSGRANGADLKNPT